MQPKMVFLIQDYALLRNGIAIMICVPIRVRPKKCSSTTIYVSFSLLKGERGATGPPGFYWPENTGVQVITFLRSYNTKLLPRPVE